MRRWPMSIVVNPTPIVLLSESRSSGPVGGGESETENFLPDGSIVVNPTPIVLSAMEPSVPAGPTTR